MTRRRIVALVVAGVLMVAALAGCTTNSSLDVPAPVSSVAGVQEWKPAIKQVISFEGPAITENGVAPRFSTADYKGRVLVVNFWYAGCGPCGAEAPILEKVSKEYAGKGVQFIGVNTRDQIGGAQPALQQYGVTYPSILDQSNRAAVQRAFTGAVVPSSTPTTLVLAPSHGVMARVIGQLNDANTLEDLINDALAMKS